jgi:hypothetical protein
VETRASAYNTEDVSAQSNRTEGSHTPKPAVSPSLPVLRLASFPVLAESSHIQMELVPQAQPELPPPVVSDRYPKHLDMIRVANGAFQGSHLAPEPPPVCSHELSGIKSDRRLLWKPLDLEELGRCHIIVVKLKANGMNRIDSPGSETALTPFNSLLDVRPPLSGLEPDRRLCWKLPDLKELRQQAINVVRFRNNGMSRRCSPRHETALTPFAPRPAMMLRAPSPYSHAPYELWNMAAVERCTDRINVVSTCNHKTEGSHLLEPLLVCCHRPLPSRFNRQNLRKSFDVEMRARCSTNKHICTSMLYDSNPPSSLPSTVEFQAR